MGEGIVGVLIVVAIIGLLLWVVTTYVPLAPPFKQIITAVVVIATILWLLHTFGLFSGFPRRLR